MTTTTASPVSKQTASAAQETSATGAAATAIETIETGVAGVAGAATNAAANAIEDLEAAESHGFSTRFPLNSAFIFTFGALGGMLFGFDTGIISGASPLIESDFGLSVSQTGFITSSVLIGSCAGALSIGALSDRFGRKKLLIVSALLFLLGSGLCASSTGYFPFCSCSCQPTFAGSSGKCSRSCHFYYFFSTFSRKIYLCFFRS